MIRVYLNADGTEHRVLSLDTTAPADLPPVDTAHGETTVDLDRALPNNAVERWDVATRTFVARAGAPRARRFTPSGFMLARFNLQEHDRYSRVLRGLSPVNVDANGKALPLTDAEQDMAGTLDRLLRTKPHIDPASDLAGAALGYCAALHIIDPADIAAKHVAVTDAEFALGPDVAIEVEA